ncbi:MAG TPA: asparagine synthase (glutamine-hydrolyzing) [Gemmataceae bacterium]|jgi:asparagine synthase (glutamine-hydrolysing)|nr:asparagine synthase (glutamine-hydrolyzing) [Gemmataceae bacterium]
MCGIAGFAGVGAGLEALAAMATAMHHRGPDDEGIYTGASVGLAFRRLAIVDLKGGRQPMSNEDGRLRLVFNGEIYDHGPLRKLLESRGHRFVTDHSDTEVLVHGWEEWGYDLFPRLNGMFAVAIWDQARRTLVLARDRYGIKPLYLASLPQGGLVFASEIKAILASGLVASQPCHEGILEYFSFQNVWREPTMFRGIHQLEAGVTLTWGEGRLARRCYWDIQFPRSRPAAFPDLVEEHRDILARAIRRQIAADVPVKSYLSGGIDSTSITVVSQRLDAGVTAYSCTFDLHDVGDDRQVDEREFARLVAQTYGLDHVELQLSQDVLQTCLTDYVTALEDLRMGMGYPVYLIARRVARDAKVVLSGTGGDEFHAGYVGRYQALGMAGGTAAGSWKRRLRTLIGGPAQAAAGPAPETTYRRILNFMFKAHERGRVFTPEFLREANGFDADAVISDFLRRCPSDDWRDRVMYVDAKTYLAGLLALEDKVSMAHALETRVPLLDNELVDFILDVPFDTLWRGPTGKILFRESVKPWVPERIYAKPKMGFGPPDASWYRGRLRPWIEETLSPRACRQRGVFQPAFVQSVLDSHFGGRKDNTHLIWSLLNFEAWCQAFGFFGAAA